ncbi:MAG TPA: hypothetical protein VE197_18650, partial [Mycobacterium sp.]|nr:hypothetical protein [Mycobacterium sp.]
MRFFGQPLLAGCRDLEHPAADLSDVPTGGELAGDDIDVVEELGSRIGPLLRRPLTSLRRGESEDGRHAFLDVAAGVVNRAVGQQRDDHPPSLSRVAGLGHGASTLSGSGAEASSSLAAVLRSPMNDERRLAADVQGGHDEPVIGVTAACDGSVSEEAARSTGPRKLSAVASAVRIAAVRDV